MVNIESIKEEAKTLLKNSFLKHEKTDEYLDPKHRHKIYGQLEKILLRISEKYRFAISDNELKKLEEEIINDLFGFGIIENLMQDPDISDIIVNGPEQIYVEKGGKLEKVGLKFSNAEEIYSVIQRMMQESERRVDISSPYADFRVKGGIRVTAVIPPVSALNPSFCIRKVYKEVLSFGDLIKLGSFTQKMVDFIKYCVRGKLNILISGPTGVGKTTLMHLMIKEFIPDNERIVMLEDTEEIVVDENKNAIKLLTRPPNIEGKGEITLKDLVKLSLHLRPDRIIIGEIRSEEAFHFLHVINTGHEGSMCTVHASNPEDALNRLEVLSLMDRSNITPGVVRRFLKLGIDVIFHMIRLSDGQRIISQVSEFDYDADGFVVKDIFSWHKSFRDHQETSEIGITGYVPSFLEKLKTRTDIPDNFFMV